MFVDLAVFRGVIAAASLKPLDRHGVRITLDHVFRGVIAAASLKREIAKHGVVAFGGFSAA